MSSLCLPPWRCFLPPRDIPSRLQAEAKRDWKKLGKLLGIVAVVILAAIFLNLGWLAALVVSAAGAAVLAWFFLKTKDK